MAACRIFSYFLIISLFFNAKVSLAATSSLDPIFYESSAEEFSSALFNPSTTVEGWVRDLNSRSLPFLCLGERHQNKFRQFFANFFFPHYDFDVLFMEGTQSEVDELVSRSLSGENDVNFLGADISSVIVSVHNKNPDIKFIGVELTRDQKRQTQMGDRRISREGFIAQNVLEKYDSNKKHVMFYGANHCAQYDIGLGRKTPAYKHIQKVIPTEHTRSVRLVFHDNGSYFTNSLAFLNLPRRETVFVNTRTLPDSVYNYVWDMKEHFTNFDDLIYAY
jgi:hypothetical protein